MYYIQTKTARGFINLERQTCSGLRCLALNRPLNPDKTTTRDVFWVLGRSKARREWPTLVLFFTEYSNWNPSSNSLSSIWLRTHIWCQPGPQYKFGVCVVSGIKSGLLLLLFKDFGRKEVGGKNNTIRTNIIIKKITKKKYRVRVSRCRRKLNEIEL